MRDPDPAKPKRAPARAPRRLRAALGLAVACAILLLPASALAGSAGVSGTTLTFTGGPERNSVTVRWDHGRWEVEDSATVSAGPGCVSESSQMAVCGTAIDRIVVNAGDGDDRVSMSSLVGGSIAGEGGDDTIAGGRAADYLDGGPGTDSLYGSSGDDLLDGGLGSDRLSGGRDADTVSYESRTGAVRVGPGDGEVGDAGDGDGDPDGHDGDDGDDGEAGEGDDVRKDVENARLGAGDDTYLGGSAANVVQGGPGSDTLLGGDGDDTLEGGAGIDVYEGGKGGDTLRARDGSAEHVSCGEDADIAVVDPADRVTDCEQVDAASGGLQLVVPESPLVVTRGELTLPVMCPADATGACQGTITLELVNKNDASASRRGGRRRVGRRSFRVDPGQTSDVTVRISRRGRRVIARRRVVRLRARIETQTATGPVTTLHTLRVKASRRGGRRAPAAPARK